MPTWNDNADGTGITVAVTGAATDEHILYVQNVNSNPDNWVFSEADRITGPGNLTSSIQGFHWWYVESAGVPNVVRAGYATNDDDATHFQCLTTIQARIRSLALQDIKPENVVVRKIPTDRGWCDGTQEYPGIIISGVGVESQSVTRGTNLRDDIEYPVFVSILAADNQDLESNYGKYLKWRQIINKSHRNQRLPGVDCVTQMKVQPGPITSPTKFWENEYHSSLVIRCLSREGRGI